MQKEDSFLLSHSGLWHYLNNDVNLFDEVKRKHLSSKWIESDITIQVREIAHNIRTKYNDRIKRERMRYLKEVNQYNLFKNRTKNIILTHYGV